MLKHLCSSVLHGARDAAARSGPAPAAAARAPWRSTQYAILFRRSRISHAAMWYVLKRVGIGPTRISRAMLDWAGKRMAQVAAAASCALCIARPAWRGRRAGAKRSRVIVMVEQRLPFALMC